MLYPSRSAGPWRRRAFRVAAAAVLAAVCGFAQAPAVSRDLVVTEVGSWPSEQKRWALIIGIDEYVDPQITALNGAANDAEALARELEDRAGFPHEQIVLMTRKQPQQWRPTRTNILRQLAVLRRSVPEDGLLLVSFAGHGIDRGGRAFLLPSDASMADDVDFLEDTALSIELMQDRIKRVNVKQVVFLLDACRNDPAAGRSDTPNPMTRAFREFRFDVANREVEAFATLYATAVGQRAYEYTERDTGQVRGYFTAAVIEGLRGAAASPSGEVTLNRLVDYVQTTVPRRVSTDLGATQMQRPFAEINGYRADDLVIAKVEVAPQAPPAELSELEYWLKIDQSRTPSDYIAYLEQFPQGRYSDVAFYQTVKLVDQGAAEEPKQQKLFTYEEYLRRYPQGQYAEAARWSLIESSTTPEDYRRFLEIHPSGPYSGMARAALEARTWEGASASNTVEAYEAYVREFPGGVYRSQAESAMVRLEWDAVAESGDPAALAEFAERRPSSPYADAARNRAQQLDWESVRGAGQVAELRGFLDRHPEGPFADLARVRIEELERPAPEAQPAGGTPGVVMQQGSMAVNPKDRLEYALVPAGEFEMGCVDGDSQCRDEEKPRHKVTIGKGFWMSRTEVTVQAYRRYAREAKVDLPKDTDANPKWRFTDHPITRTSWEESDAYCRWAGGRLPTEAEWEYAARGGLQGRIYPWANEVDRDQANFKGKRANDRWDFTSPVRSFDPNGFGLYEMAGNVWEWTADWYGPYSSSEAVDPKGPPNGKERVLRGGSWHSSEDHLRVSMRHMSDSFGNVMGFRCVLDTFPGQ